MNIFRKHILRNKVALFADGLGLQRQTVYSYLRKEKMPSPDTICNIAIRSKGEVMPNDVYDHFFNLSEKIKSKKTKR